MLRHLCRFAALAAVVIVLLLNNYGSLKGQYGGQEQIDNSMIYSKWDKLRGSSPHLEPYDTYMQGSLWSFAIGDFRISDPLALFQTPHLLWASALIPIIATVLLGRIYCGWICPMGLLSEAVTKIREVCKRFGILFFSLPMTSKLKYVILVVGVVLSFFASTTFFHLIYPPRIISDTLRDAFVGQVTRYGLIFLGVLLLMELLFVERLWCRCLCPGGGLYSLLGRFRLLKIRRDRQTCTQCKKCDVACPHELQPSTRDLGGECDNCGLCRKSCPVDSLTYLPRTTGKEDSHETT